MSREEATPVIETLAPFVAGSAAIYFAMLVKHEL